MNRSDTVLQAEGLSAGYGHVHVVRDVNISIHVGEAVALVGRNGAGKTTLMLALAGLLDLVEGSIKVEGSEIVHAPAHERPGLGVGLVPSEGRLFKSLTVDENLTIGTPHASEADLEPVLDLFPELRALRKRYAGGLSGGERQMVAIGRALMLKPRMLLLDEPSEGLAPVVVSRLVDAMQTLEEQGVAMLLAEQNVRFTAKVTSRSYLIRKGQVSEGGNGDQ